jgi:WD40 repeat protein
MRIRVGVLLLVSCLLGLPIPGLNAREAASEAATAVPTDSEEPRAVPDEPLTDKPVFWLQRAQHVSPPFKFVGIDSPENRMATFTPDGSQVAIILWDARVSYYETTTGRLIRDVWLAPRYESHSLRGHLADNGLWAAVSDEVGDTARVRVWDLTTGALKNTIYYSGQLDPFHFYLGTDGKTLYHLKVVMENGKRFVRSWDVAIGKPNLIPDDDPAVKAIRPAPDSLTSPDGKYRLEKTEIAPAEVRWQVVVAESGKRLWPESERVAALEAIQGVTISPNGQWVAAYQGQFSFATFLWDSSSGKLMQRHKAQSSIVGVGFRPDNRRVAWCRFSFEAPAGEMAYDVDEVPAGARVSGQAARAQVLDWLKPEAVRRGTPYFWKSVADMAKGGPQGAILANRIQGLRTEPKQKKRVKQFTTYDGRFHVRVDEPEKLSDVDPKRVPETISVFELATGERVGRLVDLRDRLYATFTGADGMPEGMLGEAWMQFVRPSPDGRRVFLFGPDGTRVWDLLTNKVHPLSKEPGLVGWQAFTTTADVSPDGRRVAMGCVDGSVLIWDVKPAPTAKLSSEARQAAWEELRTAGGAQAIWKLAGDPDGTVSFLGDQLRPATAADADDPLYLKSSDQLRAIRAVAALEYAGTPAASEVLKRIAAGEPNSRFTQEAAAALARLTASKP